MARCDGAFMRAKLFANQIAKKGGMSFVHPEILAFAVIDSGPNVVTKILGMTEVDLDSIKNDLSVAISNLPVNTSLERPDIDIVGISEQTKRSIAQASDICNSMEDPAIGAQHIILGVIKTNTVVRKIFEKHNVTFASFRESVKQMVSVSEETIGKSKPPKEKVLDSPMGETSTTSEKKKKTSEEEILSKYCRDLTSLASAGKLDPVIGRDAEMGRILVTLSRRKKNNPILVGDPGVGKTSVVEGVAQRISSGKVSKPMRDKRIMALNMTSVVSGTQYRGQFEEKMRAIVEVFRRNPKLVLFVDEIHTILGAGGSIGGLDAANIMKPALASGDLRCIGATTDDEYRKYFRKDGALERRFQPVIVDEPSQTDTVGILHGVKEVLEDHHQCVVSDEAVAAAVELSVRHMLDRRLPDKAIDCLDEACATFSAERIEKGEKPAIITKDDVVNVIAMQSGIPMDVISSSDIQKAMRVEQFLSKRVIGQPEAVGTVSRVIRNAFSGVRNPDRPIGSFMLGGPASSGKGHLAEVLAEALFSSNDSVIRINLSEYQEGHYQSKLIGSPPGYVGFGERNQLTDKILRRPYSVVLLDGMQYAHPKIVGLFANILSEGMLTDSDGRKVSFRHAVIVMTVDAVLGGGGSTIGFNGEEKTNGMKAKLASFCKKKFGDDFVSRIDHFIPFGSLNREHLEMIAESRVAAVGERIAKNGFSISANPNVYKRIAEMACSGESASAKDIERIIERDVEDKISECIMSHPGKSSDIVLSVGSDKNLKASRKVATKKSSRK